MRARARRSARRRWRSTRACQSVAVVLNTRRGACSCGSPMKDVSMPRPFVGWYVRACSSTLWPPGGVGGRVGVVVAEDDRHGPRGLIGGIDVAVRHRRGEVDAVAGAE